MLRVKFETLWVVLGLVMIAIVAYFSVIPAVNIQEFLSAIPFELGQPLAHFFAYAFLMFCFSKGVPGVIPAITLVLGLVFMGTVLEVFQELTPNRGFEYGDIVANVVGMVTGYSLANFLKWGKRQAQGYDFHP